jgi:hypothetical protein
MYFRLLIRNLYRCTSGYLEGIFIHVYFRLLRRYFIDVLPATYKMFTGVLPITLKASLQVYFRLLRRHLYRCTSDYLEGIYRLLPVA